MHVAFGNPIQNQTKTVQGKKLLDHESLIKDVCAQCNNVALSPYDAAGKEFVAEVETLIDPTLKWFSLDQFRLGWLIKTHLNCIRTVPNVETKKHYSIDPRIYVALRDQKVIPLECIALFVEGIQGKPGYFWGRSDDVKHRIQYFGFKSVEFRRQKILCSDLKIKCLNTFLFLPADMNYEGFPQRVIETEEEMRRDIGFNLQPIDLTRGGFKVTNVTKYLDVRQISWPG